jgi:hypothetical protein
MFLPFSDQASPNTGKSHRRPRVLFVQVPSQDASVLAVRHCLVAEARN